MQKWVIIALGVFVFGGGLTTAVLRGQATAQDTDAERISALETRVAELTADVIALTTDYADQLLPEPRPVSDFSDPNVEISDDAITLFCAQYPLDDYHLAVTCDQVTE